MQELASPWMHWFPQRFVQRTDSDRVLVAQFAEAHEADTQYGGIPIATITNALDEGSGAQLEALVRAEGFGEQPNPFDAQIATEMKSGTSPTWQARFDTHLARRSDRGALPARRRDRRSEAKRGDPLVPGRGAGRPRRDRSLLDLREVFSDDAGEKLSFVPQPAADGQDRLAADVRALPRRARQSAAEQEPVQRAQAREMTRAEKDLAIARISRAGQTRMPPWRVGSLTPDSIRAATLELQK